MKNLYQNLKLKKTKQTNNQSLIKQTIPNWSLIHFITSIAIALALTVSTAQAADVVLTPAYISGEVQLGTAQINRLYISAHNGTESSSVRVSNANNYTLTVNVPENGSLEYSVFADITSENGNDFLRTKKKLVVASDGETSILNFTAVPGYVRGKVTVTGGGTLSTGYIAAYHGDSSDFTNAQTNYSSNGEFHFPVMPNNQIRISGKITLTDGRHFYLNSQYIDLATDETKDLNITIDVPAADALGVMHGDIVLAGATEYTSASIYGTTSGGNFNINLNSSDAYRLEGLKPGDWYLYMTLYSNYRQNYYRFPFSAYSRPVTVLAGSEVKQDFVAQAAFASGAIDITGSVGWDRVNTANITGNGIYNTPTFRGLVKHRIAPNGQYHLTASEGDWTLSKIDFNFYDNDPDNYLSSFLYIDDKRELASPVTLVAAQTRVHNYKYPTGTVTIRFSVKDGGELSNPVVGANCSEYDDTNTLLYNANGNAVGKRGLTTLGTVTFVGIPSNCNFSAYAYVGGSWVSFGSLENIRIEQGIDIVVDVDGPTLNIATPTAEFYTTNADVIVSGTVTDDTGVTSVTVNGVTIDLVSTNNPDDANEVRFSTTVSIFDDINSIETVATDTTGKTATDTRRVFQDAGPPEISWTPVDGTVTSESTVTVSGIAIDDNFVNTVKVNGVEVQLSQQGEGFSFSTSVALQDGANQIVVSASDNTFRSTSQTHTITKVDNVAPSTGEVSVTESLVAVGTSVTASVAFTDPGDTGLHNANIDWGDGTIDVATVNEENGAGDASASHAYSSSGVYTVTITITDQYGETASSHYQYVVVYDPTAGFVTGGGWIDSPAGAYLADPSLTGKASFGFNAKYKKGASTPDGNTQFQFRAAGLNFHSSSYDWLVVAGATAKFKGIGTVNGLEGYAFMLSAVDGEINGGGGVDKFRIKIWVVETEELVYDNQLGDDDTAPITTAISKGSIIIHE